MKKIRKEFIIGFVAIVSLVLLYFGMNYLKGINLFQQQRVYFSVYESVDGLSNSNPVLLNGFKVGFVKNILLMPGGQGKLLVELVVNDKELQIPKDSEAKIASADLFGSKAIQLTLGQSETMAIAKDTLIGVVEESLATALRQELEPLKKKTIEMISSLEEMVSNLKAVIDHDATRGLPQVFESLQRSMHSIEQMAKNLDEMVEENSMKIGAVVDNVNDITSNIRANNDMLTNIVTNFSAFSDSLAEVNFRQTMLHAEKAMADFASVMEKIDKGEGSIGQLINNDTLHVALLQTNQELQYLLNDLYQNPWKYVHVSIFGKKPKKNLSKKEMDQLEKLIQEELDKK